MSACTSLQKILLSNHKHAACLHSNSRHAANLHSNHKHAALLHSTLFSPSSACVTFEQVAILMGLSGIPWVSVERGYQTESSIRVQK